MPKAKDKFVKTQGEFAEALGIARQNLGKSWTHRVGWPPKTKQGYNVRTCMEFIRGVKEAAREKRETGPHADLKERKLKVECEILDEKLALLKGDSISMDEHLHELATHAGIVKSVFRQWLEGIKTMGVGLPAIKEAERLESKSMAGIRAGLEEVGNE